MPDPAIYILDQPVDGETLEGAKAKKIYEIDQKTAVLLNNGFTHNSNSFSLAPEFQIRWLWLQTLGTAAFPVALLTTNNTAVSLSFLNMPAFVLTAALRLKAIQGGGAALKNQVTASGTIEAVNAIVDERE